MAAGLRVTKRPPPLATGPTASTTLPCLLQPQNPALGTSPRHFSSPVPDRSSRGRLADAPRLPALEHSALTPKAQLLSNGKPHPVLNPLRSGPPSHAGVKQNPRILTGPLHNLGETCISL